MGDLGIYVAGHSVKRDGRSLSLMPLEFDLLVALARKPGQVFTLMLGSYLYPRIADGVVNDRIQTARAEATSQAHAALSRIRLRAHGLSDRA